MQVRRWLIVMETIALKFVFGILPLSFDRRYERFYNRTKDLILSIVCMVLHLICGPIVCVVLYAMNVSQDNQITNVLSAFQFAFVFFFILLVQIIFVKRKESLHALLNEAFHLKHVLERVTNRSIVEFRSYTLFLFKIIIVDIFIQLLTLYTFEENTLERAGGVLFVCSLLFYLMMYIITIIENCILLGVLICGVMQEMINIIMKQLARSRLDFPREGSSPIRGRPSVLQMYMLHCKNEEIVTKFVETLNCPTLMLTAWYFFMIVYSVYYMYVYAFEVSQRGVRLELNSYFNPLIFFLYQCAQLYLLVLIPSVYTDHAKKMLRLLNYVTANQHPYRPAQERLIEVLMIDCMQRNYSISNYGMYALNRALLFGMIATMTSYLIILIQFHIQSV
uniref:Gustatory receptor n=1 Tax=Anopheles epiroticus TaxID=199890 RepID=A0A182PZ14_9DIPT